MYKYERIIYWSEEDNAFIVEVPELPGCMADGATVEEAIAGSPYDKFEDAYLWYSDEEASDNENI